MQRPSSTTRNRSSGPRGTHSMGGRSMLPSGRSSSLTRISGASQGRYSEAGRLQTKDTRPVTDKAFLLICAEKIIKFMADSGYNTTNISSRSLLNPSLKDFFGMFEFLFGFFKYQFKYTMKPEDEVPKLVKTLRYPFTINRSMLLGLGSRQTWGCLLGLLVWMIDYVDVIVQGEDYFKFLEEKDGEEFDGICYSELLLEGVCERYREFMQTGQTDDDRDAEMFERCVETFVGRSNVDELQDNNDRLREQLESLLKRKNELSMKENGMRAYEQDIERMQQYFSKLKLYMDELKESLHKTEEDIRLIEVEIEPLRSENSSLKALLGQQESEANQFKVLMAKRKASEERFNAAVLLHNQLENTLTDKQVRSCSAWHKIKKSVIDYENLYQNIQDIVNHYDDKLASVVTPCLANVPGVIRESMTLAEADQILVQLKNLFPALKDHKAGASKAALSTEGTLTGLREFRNELRQDEGRLDAAIKAEELKTKSIEEEFCQKICEIDDAVERLDLRDAEKKTDAARNLEQKRKTVRDLELKLEELRHRTEEMGKETELVLEKALLRIINYREEKKIGNANFARKVRSVVTRLS